MAEQPENASPKKVGLAERNSRMDQLRSQLVGVSITGQLEPSHALLDMTVQQWDNRCLKHIGPEKCHSREDEVQNLKPLSTSISLEGGKLKITEGAGLDDRDIEGSLQVVNALRRRGIAYAFARLISWARHEAYLASLFAYLTQPAQAGYRKVSLRQVLRADKLAFAKMAEAGEDIRADASGKLPLGEAVSNILKDYSLIVALLPLADVEGLSGKGRPAKWSRPGPYTPPSGKKGKYGKGAGGGKGFDSWGGKGKAPLKGKDFKGKGAGSSFARQEWLPEGLRYQGASAWSKRGGKVCYGYNLGSCTDPACQKGEHCCIIFSCGAFFLADDAMGGVLICVPAMALPADVIRFCVHFASSCLQRSLPLVIEGRPESPLWSALGESRALTGLPFDLVVNWKDHKSETTRIVSNMPEIQVVSSTTVVPRQSGSRPTKEAGFAYPAAFATMLADVFSTAIEARGIRCRSAKIANRHLRASAMLQSRGASPYPVVDEWKLVVYVLVPVQCGCDPLAGDKRLKEAWPVPPGVAVAPSMQVLPADSQLLSRAQSGGLVSPQLQQKIQEMGEVSILRVGIPWDPLEFIAQAGPFPEKVLHTEMVQE
ncbi:unnamed protein product, partial [Symbiodinium sp. CCMP2456]